MTLEQRETIKRDTTVAVQEIARKAGEEAARREREVMRAIVEKWTLPAEPIIVGPK